VNLRKAKYGAALATLGALGLVLGAVTLVALTAAERLERRMDEGRSR
jgi:hypothetical protein